MDIMSIYPQKIMNFIQFKSSNEGFEVTQDNGYMLFDHYYIPAEMLSVILSYIPSKKLVFNCRPVCKAWLNIIDLHVWKIKLERANYPIQRITGFHWLLNFIILTKAPLHRNLLKNGCGQEGLDKWNILSNGGDGWIVENPPIGCENIPEDYREEVKSQISCCFVTSYYSDSKDQLIKLEREGASPQFMDIVQPRITITEWYCGRFDCEAIYQFEVTLLDENKNPLICYEIKKSVGGDFGYSWQKVFYEFKDYGPGVRYIRYYHMGRDTRFWSGHYGSKMTGGSVTLSLP